MSSLQALNNIGLFMKDYQNDFQTLLDKSGMSKKELFADYALYCNDTNVWSEDKKTWSENKQNQFVNIYSHWMCCNFE